MQETLQIEIMGHLLTLLSQQYEFLLGQLELQLLLLIILSIPYVHMQQEVIPITYDLQSI